MKNTVLVLVAVVAVCLASATYVGYSGAPTSKGACASLCHGSGSGTITVSGFPTTYTPGQAYTITVAHNGGSTIENFNASVRTGAGAAAGTITAGTNTEVYNVSEETNGVHFATPGRDNGTFTWTAPSPGAGAVTLYLAGHQGAYDGPNTEVALTAQGGGIAEAGSRMVPARFRLEQTVVTTRLVLRIDNPRSCARMRIVDREGRVVGRRTVAAGSNQAVAWPLLDESGSRLAAGSYCVTFSTPGASRVARFMVVSR
jgi:hypothetical protein